jgi:outer membrane autotransporter protein
MNNLPLLNVEAQASQAVVASTTIFNTVTAVKLQYRDAIAAISPSAGEGNSRFSVWGGAFYRTFEEKNHDGYYGFDSDSYGAVIGFLTQFFDSVNLGFYVSAGKIDTKYKSLDTKIDSDFFQIGILGSLRTPVGLGLAIDFSWSKISNDSTRSIPFAGSNLASFDQNVFSAGLELDYAAYVGKNTLLRPFVDVRFQDVKQHAFREVGTIFAQELGEMSLDAFSTTFGAEISHDAVLSGGVLLTPSFKLAWRHQFGDRKAIGHAQFINSPGYFNIESINADRSQGIAGVGLEIQPGGADGSFSLSLDYDYGFSKNTKEHNISLIADYRW